MLDLHRLRTLRGVAAERSITDAARVLHLTPSAVSQQIAKLEEEIGQPLLERQGRGVRLTGTAERLVEHAEAILALVEKAEHDLEAARGQVLGTLTVVAFATATREILPEVVRSLRDEHPNLSCHVHEMEPVKSIAVVTRGDADIAIVDSWANAPLPLTPKLQVIRLQQDLADLALPVEHPLAGCDRVELTELSPDQPWITWPQGSICHDWLVHTLSVAGTRPRIAHTAMEHSTQLALVAAGLGAAIIPRLGRGDAPDRVRFVELVPTPTRTIHVVWRRGTHRRPAIHAAVQALRLATP